MSFTLKIYRPSESVQVFDIGHEPDIQIFSGEVQAEITTFRGVVHKVYAGDIGKVLNKYGNPVHVFDGSQSREFVVNKSGDHE